MKTVLISALTPLALFGTALAQMDGTSKASIGYQALEADDVTVGSIVGRYNYAWTQNFSVEGELSYGVQTDDIGPTEVSANLGYAGFGVIALPLDQMGTNVFARVGYGSVEIEGEAPGFSETADVDGVAFGIGGNWMFAPQNGLRLDYTRIEGDDIEANGYSIAYVFQF